MSTSTELFEEAFTDEPQAEACPAPIVIDRSTAERYATCPLQGWMIERGIVSNGSTPADVGNAIHKIIGDAVKSRAEHGAQPHDLRDQMQDDAAKCRPDLQPMVVERLWSIYRIVDLICRHADTGEVRNPDDLMRFDGGDMHHSGQLAADIIPAVDGKPAVRLTGELDLLLPTASPERVDLYDWKSGWRHYTAGDVSASFQLAYWYPWLIFRNYPGVQRVGVRVFMVANGEMTDVVIVDRKDFYTIEKRLLSAVQIYLTWSKKDDYGGGPVPTWPAPEKCSICDFVLKCTRAHEPTAEAARDPEGLLQRLVVLDEQSSAIRKILTGMVKDRGADLVYPGVAFGQEKPPEKAPRAKACAVYEPPVVSSGDDFPSEPTRATPNAVGLVATNISSDQADKLRQLASEDQAQARALEVAAKERREKIASCVTLEWPEFVARWHSLISDTVSGSDFAAGVPMLVDSVGKKGREKTISKATRAKWVEASLVGKLNFISGKVIA